jgi:hypothetical protein
MTRSVLALTLCAVSGAFSGCDTDKTAKLEKQNQELQAQLQKQQSANLDLQAKCSRDARVWFNEEWPREKDTILLDFTNHYNKSMNKCFILVEYHFKIDKGESWGNDMTLWDVYENTKYAHFYQSHFAYIVSGSGYKTTDQVITCEDQEKKCRSLDEFNNAISSYMNN